MLQALPERVNGENINDANEVALLRSIDDMQRVLQVRQQTSVLGPKVWAWAWAGVWAWMKTTTN